MNKDTSGPAFPVTLPAGAIYNGHEPFDGMSLRDWFAATATENDIKSHMDRLAPRNGFGEPVYSRASRAEARYAHADVMLEARSK